MKKHSILITTLLLSACSFTGAQRDEPNQLDALSQSLNSSVALLEIDAHKENNDFLEDLLDDLLDENKFNQQDEELDKDFITPPAKKAELDFLWHSQESLNNMRYSHLVESKYLTDSIIGQMSHLESLLASYYVDQLLNKNVGLTKAVVKRTNLYINDIVEELKKRNMPIELAALPLVESSYTIRAVSQAGAAGLWQIMPRTGRSLGLTVNNKVDERLNVKKSTAVALEYLQKLHDRFQDWPLAIAAYNCGETRLARALRISKTDNLIDLLDYCENNPHARLLSIETIRYVPKFIAAFISLKELEILNIPDNEFTREENIMLAEKIEESEMKITFIAPSDDLKKKLLLP